MTLSNLLMTAYVNKASEAGKGVWDILEEVAREHLTNELFDQAAGLLDPDTTVDLNNEYHRGLTELIMRVTNRDSDDKEDVAQIISERTMTPRARLDAVINRHFPNRLLTFYIEGSDDLAAVEDHNGNMWRVWADGNTQKYSA